MFSKKEVRVGSLRIGGRTPVVIQSMCTTDTRDIKATVDQIRKLAEAGCEIVRLGVPDMASAEALESIRKQCELPLVADIHFDYRIALKAADFVDKLRINPGNIGHRERVAEVVKKARERRIPIRIGVNAGSLERKIVDQYGTGAKAMVASALEHIKILEDLDFTDIVVSLKASDVSRTLAAYQDIAKLIPYPLHLGVTEAGTMRSGTVKSAIGIGALLAQGIGDTIRVSLAEDPVEEVKVGWEILKALGLRKRGVEVTACPSCARTNFDVSDLAQKIEAATQHLTHPWHLAVMGCAVNGPGEAKVADLGIVGGLNDFALYKKGKIVRKITPQTIVTEFLEELSRMEIEESFAPFKEEQEK